MTSCYEGDVIPSSNPEIIVEGWAEAGQNPHVRLTTSINISKEYQSLDSLGNHILRYASVSITDNGIEYYLTGKARGKKYSFPFEYTTGKITCIEGHEYKLRIDYEKFHVEATTTIPNQCTLDTIFAMEVSPSLYKIVAVPTNGKIKNAIFFIQSSNTGGDYQFSRQISNNKGEIEIFKPLQQGINGSDQYFHKGEEVFIKYSNMQADGKLFWDSYEEVLTLSRNYFMPLTDNIESNINGGIGYWLGYNSSYYRIVI